MLEVKLEADLEQAVARQARLEKKSKASLVRSALRKYLEDAEDYRDALAVLKKKNPSVPLEEVEARLGLAGSAGEICRARDQNRKSQGHLPKVNTSRLD